ncbi:MAG: type II toxin-antitoxin system VapC family toxin [Syntrophothermus sp.]
MINYFLDTSALFKRYIKEAGSDNVASLFERQARFTIASLTISEVLANLRRLVDVDKLLDDGEYARLKSLFLGDISDGFLDVVEVTTSIILESAEIVSKRFLTPIDSIQLATALLANDGEDLIFVCADDRLCQRATAEGLKVYNPLKPD